MNSLIVLFIILTGLLILVSGVEGIRNLVGLGLNFILIFAMITLLSWGMNTFVLLSVVSVLILAIAIYMSSDDNKMKKTLGETGGLGTVATRADIIEKLFHSFLLEKKGNEILLTSKGKQLLELVPEDLKKPELTASWEMELAKIAKGAHKEQVFIKDIESYTKELIRDIKTSDGTFRHDNLTNTKCPHCG